MPWRAPRTRRRAAPAPRASTGRTTIVSSRSSPSSARGDLLAYASELGLDPDAFARCLDERRFAADVERDIEQAQALGINSTPTFLINGRP
jgi:hypothetical protein